MMKKIFGMAAISALAFSMFACSGEDGADGINGKDGKDGADGVACSVKALKDDSGFKIVCDGDSVGVLKNGTDGADGKAGKDGKDGEDGSDGSDGSGKDGKNGADGKDGASCTAKAVKEGFQIICGTDTVGVVKNGENGEDGDPGKPGENCTLEDDGNGSLTVTCGKTSVNLFKSLCQTLDYFGVPGDNTPIPYEPETHLCYANMIQAEDGSISYVNYALPKCADQSILTGDFEDASMNAYLPWEYFCDNGVLVEKCEVKDKDGNSSYVEFDSKTKYCDYANYKIADKVPCSAGNKDFYTEPGKFCYREANTPKTKMLYEDSADCHGVKYNPVTHFCKSSTGDLGTRSICAQTPASADQFNIDIRYDSEENVDSHEGQMCDSRDYQVYNTKTVNGLTWMTQSLRYALPKENNGKTADLDSGSFCYNNDCTKRDGIRAYLWSAVIDSAKLNSGSEPKVCGYGKPACTTLKEPYQGVCPTGWHVPGRAENTAYASDLLGLGGEDDGFTAAQDNLTAGTLAERKEIVYSDDNQDVWSIIDYDNTNALYNYLPYGRASSDYAKYYAYPVRCVKNP